MFAMTLLLFNMVAPDWCSSPPQRWDRKLDPGRPDAKEDPTVRGVSVPPPGRSSLSDRVARRPVARGHGTVDLEFLGAPLPAAVLPRRGRGRRGGVRGVPPGHRPAAGPAAPRADGGGPAAVVRARRLRGDLRRRRTVQLQRRPAGEVRRAAP